jgi:hypothetical protein
MSVSDAGELTLKQQHYLGTLEAEAKVTGWLYEQQGPLIVRANGDWETVKPSGRRRRIARADNDDMVAGITLDSTRN